MANRLSELMEMQDRGARFATNVLSRAFRDMVRDLEINKEYIHVLMEVYLRDPARQIESGETGPIDPNKLANDRGNLKKEIEKDEYTIKVFMKLMRMLRFKEFSMTFNGEWYDGRKLNGGKGLTYNIDLDLEDLNSMQIDPKFRESFFRTIERNKEVKSVIEGECTSVDDDDDDDIYEDEDLDPVGSILEEYV